MLTAELWRRLLVDMEGVRACSCHVCAHCVMLALPQPSGLYEQSSSMLLAVLHQAHTAGVPRFPAQLDAESARSGVCVCFRWRAATALTERKKLAMRCCMPYVSISMPILSLARPGHFTHLHASLRMSACFVQEQRRRSWFRHD